ncbi:MAG: hypothetical protein GY940_35290, partial [bacterium]|nr:hypothetical protein [bacterium]
LAFPTPTWLYRVARKISEGLGVGIFHEERALKKEEVLDAILPYGRLLQSDILWPIVFTQAFIVLRKNGKSADEWK